MTVRPGWATLTIRGPRRSTITSNSPAARGRQAATVPWVSSPAVSTRRPCTIATTNSPASSASPVLTVVQVSRPVDKSSALRPPTAGSTVRFQRHPTERSTSRPAWPRPRSSFPKTTAFPGRNATWERTWERPTLGKTPKSPPTVPPTPTTCGRERTRVSTCPVPWIQGKHGSRRASVSLPLR